MEGWIHAGQADKIRKEGPKLVKGGIAVFYHEDQVYAVDNRCPHMGFPLHMGSLCDGILTCHWHHARFDVCSGGTLDPWADDVPVHDVRVVQGEVWVDPKTRSRAGREKHYERLQEGLEQNLSLVIAKAVIGLMEAGEAEPEIAKAGLEFGTAYRSAGWSSGFTILTAMINLLPRLDRYGRFLALFHGLSRVAADCAGRAPRFLLQPLPDTEATIERLAVWYRQCIEVRDTQGAERVLLTAIRKGASHRELSDMMLAAVTDHFYLDGGHTLDFHNKAFEVLEQIGEEHTERVLTSLVPLLSNPARSEERQNWRQPVDLVTPLHEAFARLAALEDSLLQQDAQGQADGREQREQGGGRNLQAPSEGSGQPGQPGSRVKQAAAAQEGQGAFTEEQQDERLLELLLGDQPLETIAEITNRLEQGSDPVRLARLTALAAAERIARFHTQNDFSDWIAVLHTFTHAHAVHESFRRGTGVLTIRAIYHTAVSIYLDRFLNIPAAARPKPAHYGEKGYTTGTVELLELMDQRQQVSASADWVFHYRDKGGESGELFNALGHSLLREDAEFHSYQMLEAGLVEYERWSEETGALAKRAQETLLLAVTRYLAAHAPTPRELPHVAAIAWRLQRGEKLFEEQ